MGKFWDWYFQPITECFKQQEPDLPDKPVVCLKPGGQKAPIFRPESFNEYIGQEKAKNMLKSYISGCKQRNMPFPHTILHGNAGCGKTTLARIIAKELKLPIVESIAAEIVSVYDILFKLATFDGQPGIIFLDEIHAMERNTVETIYALMEDFTYNNNPIAPFTLIGATTELGEIIKKSRPFVDRFKLWIELEPYLTSEISTIIKQYGKNVFKYDTLSDNTYKLIGENARLTPRTGIRLLESTIYLNGNIKQALENASIIKDGYTFKDLKCMKYLNENTKGVGLQGLCSYLNIPSELYMYDVEPYLLQNNIVIRTPRGRKITAQGITKMEELKKC